MGRRALVVVAAMCLTAGCTAGGASSSSDPSRTASSADTAEVCDTIRPSVSDIETSLTGSSSADVDEREVATSIQQVIDGSEAAPEQIRMVVDELVAVAGGFLGRGISGPDVDGNERPTLDTLEADLRRSVDALDDACRSRS